MAKSAISTQSKFNPKKIMIMKKVYIKPEFEIFEVEPAGMMMEVSSLNMGGDGNSGFAGGDGWEGQLSNKREPEAPWDKSPWE